MKKKVLFFGAMLGLLAIILQLAQYRFLIIDNKTEMYAGAVAVVFVILGLVMGNKLTKPKELIIEKTVYAEAVPLVILPADEQLEKLGISKREFEILQLMAQGMSNQEIADTSFVSVSTVKTHVSNILLKLDAKRRTQAVTKAREMNLVP